MITSGPAGAATRVCFLSCWGALLLSGCGASDGEESGPNRPLATCDDDGVPEFSDGIDVDSQARVEALEGCKELPSYAFIGGGDVVDLSPLQSLEVVGGFLNLGVNRDQTLETLAGLERLTSVGVWLEVSNTLLSDLDPLSGLRQVGTTAFPGEEIGARGLVEVSRNPRLTSVSGLGNLSGIRSLRVLDNPALPSLEGPRIEPQAEFVYVRGDPLADLAALAGLEAAYDVQLEPRAALDVDELSSLSTVEQGFTLDGPALESTAGLSALRSVGSLRLRSLGPLDGTALSEVTVSRLLELRDLRSTRLRFDRITTLGETLTIVNVGGFDWGTFPALTSVGGLIIADNESLTSMAPPALTTVTGDVVVANNPQLPHADAVAFAESLDVAGSVKIFGNQDSPPPLDPCPFVDDFVCDEPALCAAGTDSSDCSPDGDWLRGSDP